MISGIHTMFYSSEAKELREFLADKLNFSGTDIGGGWMIFRLPPAEMGVHPSDDRDGARSGTHDISFICDDIHATVAELQAKGVEFSDEIREYDFGFVTFFRVPGGFELQLYQPKYSA